MHEHKHEHEQSNRQQQDYEIHVSTHDSAIIGSTSFTMSCGKEKAEKIISQKMGGVADAVNTAGGIVGHIKSFIRESKSSVMLSITDKEVHSHHQNKVSCHVECVNIVFNMDLDEFKAILEKNYVVS